MIARENRPGSAVRVTRPLAPVRLEFPYHYYARDYTHGQGARLELPYWDAARLVADLLETITGPDDVLMVGGPRHGDVVAMPPHPRQYVVAEPVGPISAASWDHTLSRNPDPRDATIRTGIYGRDGKWRGWDR